MLFWTYKFLVAHASIEVDGLNQCLITGSKSSLCAYSIGYRRSRVERSYGAEGESKDGSGELHRDLVIWCDKVIDR